MSTLAVTRLELRRLFVRPLAWVLGALTLAELALRFILLLGTFLDSQIKLASQPGSPGYTDWTAVRMLSSLFTGGLVPFGTAELALLVVPLLTMSSLAGDRNQGTLPLLFATGTSATGIVLGKYLATVIWLLLWLALVAVMPLALAHATTLDWGKLSAAVLGTALLLSLLAAIGLCCSTFSSHPAIAATASLIIALAFCFINLGALSLGVDNTVLNWLALGTHYEPLLRGLVSSSDVIWFLLFTFLALALAIYRLSGERERD